MAIVNPGDEVIILSPYWLTYPELVKLCGGVPVFVEPRDRVALKATASEIEAAITKKTKAIIFNNPTNPSGVVFGKTEVEAIAKVVEAADIYVIADEIYEEFSYFEPIYSICSYSDKLKDNTILVNGMSKTFAMTGWRIGYTASNLKLAKAMESIQSHATSNPNSIAQYASVEALTSKEARGFIDETKARFNRRREMLLKELEGVSGFKVIPPQGAFYIMADVTSYFGKTIHGVLVNSAHEFATLLLEKMHVVTIPCEAFGAAGYIRFSYACSEAAIEKGMKRIKEFLSGV